MSDREAVIRAGRRAAGRHFHRTGNAESLAQFMRLTARLHGHDASMVLAMRLLAARLATYTPASISSGAF